MPKLGPIKRDQLIFYLRQIGFVGPHPGGKHQFMIRDGVRLRIPNPHQGDIGRDLLARILKQGGISREEWESL